MINMIHVVTFLQLLCLLCVLALGGLTLAKARNAYERLLGAASLTLGVGDAFQTVPELLRLFAGGEAPEWWVGRYLAGLALTAFLLLVYQAWHGYYGESEYHRRSRLLYGLAGLRAVLTLLCQVFPQTSPMIWIGLGNLALLALGGTVSVLYFKNRWRSARFGLLWLLLGLTVLFQLLGDLYPVAGAARLFGAPGALCRAAMAWLFFGAATRDEPGARRRRDS